MLLRQAAFLSRGKPAIRIVTRRRLNQPVNLVRLRRHQAQIQFVHALIQHHRRIQHRELIA